MLDPEIYFNRFMSHPGDDAERQEYMKRGLIPTNNLRVYFLEGSQRALPSGISNPYDYHQRPFGIVLQVFREANPALWDEARETAEAQSAAVQESIDLLMSGRANAADIMRADEERKWQSAEVFTRVMNLLAPVLQAAGIDPLDVCR